MLAEVQEDVDRNGALDLDAVVAELDTVIAAAERRRRSFPLTRGKT